MVFIFFLFGVCGRWLANFFPAVAQGFLADTSSCTESFCSFLTSKHLLDLRWNKPILDLQRALSRLLGFLLSKG